MGNHGLSELAPSEFYRTISVMWKRVERRKMTSAGPSMIGGRGPSFSRAGV
jgi:hypothetical protein